MSERRNLAWRLNWYRQSELEGALLLGRMIRKATDATIIGQLTKHCADEARHSWLWSRAIETLGLPPIRIHRSYQSFYLEEISTPRTLVEVLALTHVFEHRVDQHFAAELQRPHLPPVVRRTLGVMRRDEVGHLDWVAHWLSRHAHAAELLAEYRRADERVVQRLLPYGDCMWEIEGLGEESGGDANERVDRDTSEPHAA
jgi:hypothetical protein